jgi:hypothetical protein
MGQAAHPCRRQQDIIGGFDPTKLEARLEARVLLDGRHQAG